MAIGVGSISGLGGGGFSGYVPGSAGLSGANGQGAKPGFKSSPGECQTCKTRKYQDGSDENVSFKTASHISPQAAGSAVCAHEGEHVSNAYSKAAEQGGKVLSVGVSIHTAVCPECGRVYVAGGETRSVIATPKDDPYSKTKEALKNMLNVGTNYDGDV